MNKTIYAFLTLSIIFLFIRCELDPNDSEKIVDSWSVNSYEATIASIVIFQGVEILPSRSEIELLEIDYEITFTEAAFTTNGKYNRSATTITDSTNNTSVYPFMNVSKEGSYTLNEDENIMRTEISFFDFSVLNIEVTYLNEEQIMTYEFADNGDLILTQDQIFEVEDDNFTSRYHLMVKSVLSK